MLGALAAALVTALLHAVGLVIELTTSGGVVSEVDPAWVAVTVPQPQPAVSDAAYTALVAGARLLLVGVAAAGAVLARRAGDRPALVRTGFAVAALSVPVALAGSVLPLGVAGV